MLAPPARDNLISTAGPDARRSDNDIVRISRRIM